MSVVDVLLSVEHDRREDDDSHRQREHEKAEFTGARLECVAKDTKTSRVTRELEYPSVDSMQLQVVCSPTSEITNNLCRSI